MPHDSCCSGRDGAPEAGKARDPVCGMIVDPTATPHHATHAGETWHFCSAGCRAKFVAAPARYLGPREGAAAVPGAIYTCPMHPEVRQVGPGVCPKCGMALEPELVTVDARSNPEIADFTRRFIVAALLTLPLFVMEMSAHLPGSGLPIPHSWNGWIQFALATPVVLWAGWPFMERGWASLRTWNLNMFTLIALGTGVAWAFSTLAVITPALIPTDFLGDHGEPPLYFEAAAVIVTLVLLGQVLELRARERTSGAIRALLDLTPKRALRVGADGADEEIPVEHIRVGDRLRVRPGEKIPVDGVLTEGRTAVDEALVTGESMPVTKQTGDAVVAGSLNTTGSFVMRADKVGADTLLAQIVQLVAKAQRSRAPIQRLADRVAAWFVPVVVAIAAIAFIAWSLVGPEPRLAYAFVAAVSVLIIACPCALGLATPISIMVGVGRGAQAGILIRDAEALERFQKIDTLVVDKTGTLTEGRPAVTAVHPAPGFDETTLLRLAAGLERSSEHPLARALVRAAEARGLPLSAAEDFDSPVGKGVVGRIEGRAVLIGSAGFLEDNRVDAGPMAPTADALRQDGATAIFMAVDGVLAGVFAIADPIKATSRSAVDALHAEGVRLVMLTGDNVITARAVAARLGIDSVEADVSPADKAAVIERLRAEGRVVAMAGDGVNDAPALAAADVGVAMGAGADVAIESAGVTLLSGDLNGIVRALRLSRATIRNIRQNLVFAFGYNALGVPLAAGVLYPAFGLLLSPAIAALAMSLSSVSVISNALRLKAVKLHGPLAINPPSPAPRHLPNGGAAATSRANLP
ncbi:copper-translocating P-type ATPase [Brevundimonas denitrificans]|uniref:Copper-translocating P-type ATPase n=1 Tax=Brevundimonas denitrificans TaxID=1443434 RepID=A0ABQ6BNK0_9CAUL|nr:heavy metal translocating P-type ATPase [Brevundimonas denitrificans]GLS01762.1 copper-translocating P-type ATPase [Brevundimonas denitrificans]